MARKKLSLLTVVNSIKPLLLILGVSILMALVWFRHGDIMAAGESGLTFYSLYSQYGVTKDSWANSGLGNSVGIGVAAAPTYWVLSKVQGMGIPLPVVQASFFTISFFVAGFSIYLLTKELFPDLSEKFVFLAVLFYWFNPLSMVNVWNRFLYNSMIFWALLPLVFSLFLRGLNRHSYKFAILTSLSTAVFAYALTSTVFTILLLGIIFYIIVFFALFNKNSRIFLFKYSVLFTLSFLLFNLWWITQLFGFVFSGGYSEVISNFFSSAGNLSTLISISQRLGQLSNIFRFLHISFITDGPFWARVYNFPLIVLFEYLITASILWAVYKFRRTKHILFLGFPFLLTVFLIKGNEQPFGEIFQLLFMKFPPLQVFRNPFEKLGFLLPLLSAPLFSFSLCNIRRRFLYPIVVIVLCVLWGFPFWTGLMFTYIENPNAKSPKLASYEVRVPDYYRDLNAWLQEQGANFRFVSLPIGGEGITHTWPKQYSGVESSSVLFGTPNISFNTTVPFYFNVVTELSKYQLDRKILSFFPFTNSRYIVWRSDIDFKSRTIANPQMVRAKLEEWVGQGLLTKRYEKGSLSAYEVNDNWFWPKIYSTSEVSVSNSKDIVFLSTFFKDFPKKKVAFVDENNRDNDLAYTNEVYVPDKIFFQKVTTPLPKNLTDDQLLGKLFYANRLPGELIYPFIRLNEKILEIKEKDHDGLLLYRAGILGKRVAEIYKLKKLGKSADLILSTQKDYENQLSDMSPHIIDLIKRGGPIAMVVKDSLMYQWVLLGRVGLSSTTTLLSDLLSKWDVKPTFELPLSSDTYVVASFKLPTDANYLLYGIDKGVVFLDGKELPVKKSETLGLKVGKHEVSLNLEENEIFKNVIDRPDEIFVDQNNSQHWDFEIPDIPRIYQVGFDYRFITGSSFGIKIVQDLENETNPLFNNNIGMNPKYYGWQHFKGEMESAPGATKANLSFSSSKESFCEKIWWGWTKCGIRDSQFSVEIRNLKVREVDIPELALVINKSGLNNNSLSQTSFEEINSTLYRVHIDKKTSSPEVLVFSELYSSAWKLSYQDGEQFPDNSHLLVNDYANGWVITKDGNYDLLINFESQKVLGFGKKISFYSTIIASVLLILYCLWRKKHEVS